MAEKQLAILLTARDLASRTIKGVSKEVGGLGKMGRTAGKGLQSLAGNLTKLGVVAAAGLGVAVKGGLSDLAELESAVTSVDGAVKQMGLTGKVTGSQVATWANEIEAKIGAAFDDKAIVAATATLIRFGKVTPGNLKPAMQVITDLAVKTGDVDSAASLLAKALADPEKAAGKLARSGVILTKSQQAQIKAFMKAGKAADAQKVILDSLTKTTKDAAAASQGPYKRALSILADVSEDARKALAEGFLPVIERVATWLSTKLADPRVIDDIRGLGKSLAGAFDKAVTFAQDIPWGTIKDAMSMAGKGAKAAFDLFTGLPPWVQTAVVTGWGLNKLTGGALGSIIGQLGSGLIKGVLGMNAAVVNINAAVVNGAGGIPGAAAGAGGAAASGAGGAAAGAGGFLAPGLAALVAGIATPLIMVGLIPRLFSKEGKAPNIQENKNPAKNVEATWQTIAENLGEKAGGVSKAITAAASLVGRGGATTAHGGGRGGSSDERAGIYKRAVAAGLEPTAASIERTLILNRERNAAILEKNRQAVVGADQRGAQHSAHLRSAVTAAQDRTTAASRAAAGLLGTVASRTTAIANKNFSPVYRPSFNIPVYVTSTVSVRNTRVATAVSTRYGGKSRIYEP